jgi:hypothetical protein
MYFYYNIDLKRTLKLMYAVDIKKKCVRLFFYSHTGNLLAIWLLSPLLVTRLHILAYARRSGPLSREGSLSCHTYYDTGPCFIQSHPKDLHPRPTMGFEPPMQGSSDLCARRSNHCTMWSASYFRKKEHEIYT